MFSEEKKTYVLMRFYQFLDCHYGDTFWLNVATPHSPKSGHWARNVLDLATLAESSVNIVHILFYKLQYVTFWVT